MRHCIQNLMADDMVVLPAAATVYCQAAEARTGAVCGFDMSAADRYRWLPAHTSGAPTPESAARCVEVSCHGPLAACMGGWPCWRMVLAIKNMA